MGKLFKKKSIEQLLEQSQNKSLVKTLGAFDLTLLGIGAVIGTGVLVLTGLVAANDAGPAVIFSFILASIVCGFAALCYAEFASTIPVSGSVYTYTYATIGEVVAHLMGWTLLSRGTKESKKVNNFMVLVKLFIILLFIIVGAFYVKPSNWTPFMPYGIEGVVTGGAAVFFAFLGFDALSTSAEEVKNPQRNLPIGIISSLVICTIIYVAVCLVMTGVVSYKELNVPEAMAYVLHSVGQNAVAGVIAAGAVIGIMAVIFAYIYAATRILFSMSRDGLLPKAFAKTNEKTGVPTLSTWLVGIIGALISGFIDLKELANLANIGALLTFGMVGVSIIILRKTHPTLKRGFTMPFVPVLPILSVLSCLFLMINLPKTTWLYFSIWIVLGIFVYVGYSRKHSRLTSKEMKKAS